MKILARICRMFAPALLGRCGVKSVAMSLRGWYRRPCLRSCMLTGMWGMLLVGGASAAYRFARGTMSPFTGNASSDLVTVHVHVAVNTWNMAGSLFDNGSIVVANNAPKGKGQKPCGEQAATCVCAPGMWVTKRRGARTGQLRIGNEVSYFGTMMYTGDVTWQRLPGPLVVRFYALGSAWLGMPSGAAESDELATTAGSRYDFDMGWEQSEKGVVLKIKARSVPAASPKGPAAPPPVSSAPAPQGRPDTAGAGDGIHEMIKRGELAKVAALLKDKPDLVSSKDSLGRTPLDVAVSMDRKDMAELLLANHADVNAPDRLGRAPLSLAVSLDRKDMAEFLLANHADVNAPDSRGRTPLIWAVSLDRKDMAEVLLANHADVNAPDSLGRTPLSWAVSLKHKDIAKLLRRYGASAKLASTRSTARAPSPSEAERVPPATPAPSPCAESAAATSSKYPDAEEAVCEVGPGVYEFTILKAGTQIGQIEADAHAGLSLSMSPTYLSKKLVFTGSITNFVGAATGDKRSRTINVAALDYDIGKPSPTPLASLGVIAVNKYGIVESDNAKSGWINWAGSLTLSDATTNKTIRLGDIDFWVNRGGENWLSFSVGWAREMRGDGAPGPETPFTVQMVKNGENGGVSIRVGGQYQFRPKIAGPQTLAFEKIEDKP